MNTAARRLAELLAKARGKPLAVLGMGNVLLGDDGVGQRLAESVAGLGRPGLVGIPAGIALENAYGLVAKSGAGCLLVVDAIMQPDWPKGAWDLLSIQDLDTAIHSTHSVPLPLLATLWRQDIPGLTIAFLGINIAGSSPADLGLSPPVEAAMDAILELLGQTAWEQEA
jgi:hydrogenase maturation protease